MVTNRVLTAITASLAVFAVCSAVPAFGRTLELNPIENGAPDTLPEDIREQLNAKGLQLTDGEEPVFTFWFAEPWPLKAKPEKPEEALGQIAETTLLGAVEVHKPQRDYRDDELYEGLYTMRFALQPEDGDHLGTADYRYFALLVPAEKEEGVDTFRKDERDDMVEASQEFTAVFHPLILSLRPAEPGTEETPAIAKPKEEHKSVRMTVQGQTEDGGDIPVPFHLVYKGHGKL